MTTKEKVSKVGFTIEGEFITDHFRTRVSEGEWRSAFEGLKDSLVGITDEYVNAILSGQGKLIGTNSVEYVEDDIYKDKKWLKEQYYVYFNNIVKIGKDFYKPYSYVESLNKEDCQKALEQNDLYSLPINSGSKDFVAEFNRMRAKTYCEKNTDEVIYSKKQNTWILLEKTVVDYPFWLNKEDVENLLSDYVFDEYRLTQKDLEELEELSQDFMEEQIAINNIASVRSSMYSKNPLDDFMANMRECDKFYDNQEKYKKDIAVQAEKRGGWLTLRDGKTEYKIPKNPFLRWCLTNNPAYHTIDWNCVSPRGVKTGMDDPNHTDWYIFTGLDLNDVYSEKSKKANKFFDKMRTIYTEKYTNFDFVILTNYGKHKGFKEAEIVYVKSPDEVNKVGKNQLILIPEANPDYEMIANKAANNNCIVVTEIGGKLCHLVTVGREMGLTLLQVHDAFEKLPEGYYCEVDIEKGIIETIDEPIEKVMSEKISGKRFN